MIGDAIASAIMATIVAVAVITALLTTFLILGVPWLWAFVKPWLHSLTA